MIVESPSSRATVLVDTTASTTIRRGTKEEGDGHATEVTAADEYTGKRRNTWSPSSPSSSSSSSSVHAGPQCTLSRDKRRPHAVSDSLRAQEARDCNTPSESLLGNSQPTTRPSTVAALTPPSMTPSGVMPASRKGDNSDNTTVTLKMEERKVILLLLFSLWGSSWVFTVRLVIPRWSAVQLWAARTERILLPVW